MNKYYEQIDKALKSYEEYKPWHEKSVDWICDRIDWSWKWRKISESEMVELTSRVTNLFKEGVI